MSWRSSLQALFEPKSVAVIGASIQPESRGSKYLKYLIDLGFAGKIFPVNPNYAEVAGLKCYHSVGDIGEQVDFATVLLPGPLVSKALRECADVGVKAGLVVAAGMSETSTPQGIAMQKEMTEICESKELRFCGPNSVGLMNLNSNFVAYSPVPSQIKRGNVALVLQSGSVSNSFVRRCVERRIGLSYLIDGGNEAVLSGSDFLEYLVERPEVGMLATYIEGITDSEKFIRACDRARQLGKPIVALKAGRTGASSAATVSHTGKLAGSYAVFRGVARQESVIEARSLNEMIENVALLSKVRPNPDVQGKGPAFVGLAGGAIVLTTDALAESGLKPAEFSANTKAALKEILPSFVTPANPLDTTGKASEKLDLVPSALVIASKDPNVGLVSWVLPTLTRAGSDKTSISIATQIAAKESELSRPLAIVTSSSGEIDSEFAQILERFPILQGCELAVLAMRNYYWYCNKLTKPLAPHTIGPERSSKFKRSSPLTMNDGFELLKYYKIPVADWRIVSDASELGRTADELGFPLVLKPNSPDISHKSDVGAVRIRIQDVESLRSAHDDLVRIVRNHTTDTSIVVQKMVPAGFELFLGGIKDQVFGQTIMLGLGGLFIEVLKEYSTRRVPIDNEDVSEMIDETSIRHIMDGFRGTASIDRENLQKTVLNFSKLLCENSDWIAEIDVNPLMVTKDPVAVDVRVIPS